MSDFDPPDGPGPNRDAEQSRRIADENLRVFRIFCESVYRTSNIRLSAVIDHDWSAWPRLDATLQALPRPVTREAMGEAAAKLLREAVTDLAPNFPPSEGHVTALEVFELHVLEGRPWPSVMAMLDEQGRPHARGTLIRRQHELLPYLLDWMRGPETPARAVEVEVASPAKSGWRRTASIFAGVVVVAAALWFVFGADWSGSELDAGTPPQYVVATELRGRRIPAALQPGGTLPAPWPPLELPAIEGQRLTAMVIEEDPGDPRIVLTWQADDDPAPQIASWNPAIPEFTWKTRFDPPPTERLTHDGVGPEVLDQSHWVANMFHAGREGDLGNVVAMNLCQKFSPSFVIFVNIRSGNVDGYYVHPGHINAGLVYDVEGDGDCELVLAGQDNSVNRPAVVALEPFFGRRAASTVKWNEAGIEGALCRVLLPDWPEARSAIGTRRLAVLDLDTSDLDQASRILSLGIGSFDVRVYHARLGHELVLDPAAPFLLWDMDAIAIERLGLQPPDFVAWVDQVERIAGPRAD